MPVEVTGFQHSLRLLLQDDPDQRHAPHVGGLMNRSEVHHP